MALSAAIYEKLGVFYLGREYVAPDAAVESAERVPVLYASKDLTTHGICVGMTGSGKTGLCLSLLEEAAIDQIPLIAIDPKGDVGNLLLTFPELEPGDLAPWIDPAIAEREGVSVDTLAERESARLRTGLTNFGQDGNRIRRLQEAVEMVIYTPGSQAGRPLSLLRSFAAPSPTQLAEPEVLRDRVQGAVSGLLSLLGISADPLRSREHILLSQILDGSFQKGQGMSLADLIGAVQKPGFSQVGVFELETFYPAKERLELAMALNNLLAAPGAQALAQGEPLEIASLLHASSGKPKLSIISIAHLSDSERMAFVTTLLCELVAWMRGQSGTSSLRALLYMDEIFGYFPPTAAPPSKQPMLTLLKQARAFGLGILLATQNPVDLDYKGLANCGTWFIGRLQTERDKARVLDGLEGAAASSGRSFERAELDRLLSGLGKRVFLMSNVHEGAPRLIETRSTLCFLRGPVTREEIKRLMHGDVERGGNPAETKQPAIGAVPASVPAIDIASTCGSANAASAAAKSTKSGRPSTPKEASEVFFPAFNRVSGVAYRPGIYGRAKLHFVDKKASLDWWRAVEYWVPVAQTDADPRWSAAEPVPPVVSAHIALEPLAESHFAPLPPPLAIAKNYAAYRKALSAHLYQSQALLLKQCPSLQLISTPEQTAEEFNSRLEQALRERRDEAMADLQDDYREAYEKLKLKLDKAEARLESQRQAARDQSMDAVLTVGGSLLGALLGRKSASATAGRIRGAARSGAKATRTRHAAALQAAQAEQNRQLLEQAMLELEREFQDQAAELAAEWSPERHRVEERRITPRKADIQIETLQLAWRPD